MNFNQFSFTDVTDYLTDIYYDYVSDHVDYISENAENLMLNMCMITFIYTCIRCTNSLTTRNRILKQKLSKVNEELEYTKNELSKLSVDCKNCTINGDSIDNEAIDKIIDDIFNDIDNLAMSSNVVELPKAKLLNSKTIDTRLFEKFVKNEQIL
jgi:hypothetical protein